MIRLMVGGYFSTTCIEKKIIPAVYETKPQYCIDTGKRLEDRQVLVQGQYTEYSYNSITNKVHIQHLVEEIFSGYKVLYQGNGYKYFVGKELVSTDYTVYSYGFEFDGELKCDYNIVSQAFAEFANYHLLDELTDFGLHVLVDV